MSSGFSEVMHGSARRGAHIVCHPRGCCVCAALSAAQAPVWRGAGASRASTLGLLQRCARSRCACGSQAQQADTGRDTSGTLLNAPAAGSRKRQSDDAQKPNSRGAPLRAQLRALFLPVASSASKGRTPEAGAADSRTEWEAVRTYLYLKDMFSRREGGSFV